jgi:hypothetical protein
VVDGEHLTVHTVPDPRFNNSVAYRYLAPPKWHDTNQVVWDLINLHLPAKVAIKVENPANAEAFFYYKQLDCGWLLHPRANQVEGKEGSDGIALKPRQPAQAIDFFVKHYRNNVQDLKVIGTRDMPGLPKAFNVQMGPNQTGIGEKVNYKLNGQPVEEEFYAVYHYKVDQGEALWGLTAIHSFRAPAGTLNKRRNVFAAMAKSVQPTREFVQHVVAVRQKLLARYQANLAATAAEVAAAKQKSEQLTASDNQFLANVDSSLTASRASSSGGFGGDTARTANDNEDDYIRGVVTMNDPDTGTSQHSLLEQNHWTDGYGNYRDSNDASYNPNNTEVGDWQLMTPAQ